MGKAYANRKLKSVRPESDFYATPKSLLWEGMKVFDLDPNKSCLEPACGKTYSIYEELKKYFTGYLQFSDIHDKINKADFLSNYYKENSIDYTITNPPFSLFDEFVLKAKEVAREKVIFIAKVNFFGAYQRNQQGIWKHLKNVYIFNRQVDYRTPYRTDGLFHVGNLITGWFEWDLSWKKDYWKTKIIDVQKYAKLGQFKNV